jgi:hypothetical protein
MDGIIRYSLTPRIAINPLAALISLIHGYCVALCGRTCELQGIVNAFCYYHAIVVVAVVLLRDHPGCGVLLLLQFQEQLARKRRAS